MTEHFNAITNERQIEDYYLAIDSLLDGTMNHDKAKIGDVFAIAERNIKVVKSKLKRIEEEVISDYHHMPVQVTRYGEVESECTIRTGYSIWEVIHPYKLEQYKGEWSRTTWIPEILHEGIWQKASNADCEKWGAISEENKRVLFCIGVIEE